MGFRLEFLEETAVGTSAIASSPLPPLYAPRIEELLGGPVPEERHATCSSCAMCEPTNAKAATASLTVFSPETKCCTYVPTLPNFLVGMILDEDDPTTREGRASVQRRIAAGSGVTPLGLQSDSHYALIYKHAGGALFGQAHGLRCPHYQALGEGICGIWRHRNAVCATWFCKHERGVFGKRFWDTLLHVLTMVERHLSLWAAAALGESVNELGPALLPYFATMFRGSTGGWSGRSASRPEEFYAAAANLVRPLTSSQVRELGGPELALVAGQLRAAYGAIQAREMPPYLRLGAVGGVPRGDGIVALTGHSANDMLLLPTALAEVLDRFDGRRETD